MDPLFYQELESSGFKSRSSPRSEGQIVYSLANGSGHVLIPQREWLTLGREFASRSNAIGLRTKRILLFAPPAILLGALTVVPLLLALMPWFPGGLLILAGFAFWVLSFLVWHPLSVHRLVRETEAKLARFPRTQAVKRDPRRQPRVLEIIFLILVGPHLVISLIGELGGPRTFRNTPWTGANIGWPEAAGFAMILVWFAWPLMASRVLANRS